MILDTCALLWLAGGHKKLSRSALRDINSSPCLCVSAVSGFEIALKAARGKLELKASADKWLSEVCEHHGISVLPLDLKTCVAAAKLPFIHDDPCDRFIIATAKLKNMAVVTSDERFAAYGVETLI